MTERSTYGILTHGKFLRFDCVKIFEVACSKPTGKCSSIRVITQGSSGYAHLTNGSKLMACCTILGEAFPVIRLHANHKINTKLAMKNNCFEILTEV